MKTKPSALEIMNTMADAAHQKARAPKPRDEDAAMESAEEQVAPGIHKAAKKVVSGKQFGAIKAKEKGAQGK